MAIFRGVGGSGDSSDNSFLQEVTGQANAASASASAASASASAASASATSALNTELTSASFNTSDGVLTLTKQDGETVTTDLDGKYADLSGATFTGDITVDTDTLYVDTTNNRVGIGTATPDYKAEIEAEATLVSTGVYDPLLHLKATSDTYAALRLTTTDNLGRCFLQFGDSADNNAGQIEYRHSNNTMWVSTGGVTRLKLDASQAYFYDDLKVSNDVTIANGNLTVNGNADFTGNLTISGTVDGVDVAGLSTTVASKADLSGATFTGDITAKSKLIVNKQPVASDLLTTSRSIQDLAAWSVYGSTAANYDLTPEKYRDALDVNQDNRFSTADAYAIFQFVLNNYTSNELSTFQSLLNNQSNITSTFIQDVLDGDYDSLSTSAGVAVDRDASSIVTVSGDIAVSGTVDGRDVLADGTKLDGIEASADVTDATSVASAGAAMLTGANFTGDVRIADDTELKFGDSTNGDLRIFHTSSNNTSTIREQSSSNFFIQGQDLYLSDTSGGNYLYGQSGADVRLYFNGSEKLATRNTGVNVTGDLTLTGTVDGVDVAGLSTTVADKADLSGATFTGNVAVDHNLLYVDTTADKVGVGTANPLDKLHVNGTLRATDLYVTGGESYLCRTHSTTNQSLSTLRLCAISTGDMTDGFGTGITFDAQDNSGTTQAQVAEINAVRAGADNVFNLELQTGDVARLTLGTDGATFATGSTGDDRFKINSSGNVGINTGTDSISEKLDVVGNIAVSGTVDGRDVAADGTKLDGITSEASASHNYTTQLYQGYLNLTTSVNQVGPDFYLRNYSDNHYKRFAEVSGAVSYLGLTSTNDLNLRTILVVPSSSGSGVDIGSVDSITTTGTYNRDIVIVGDVSHWFSEYSGTALTANGTSTFSSIVSAIYNPTTNKTTINAGTFGITPPSVGDSIYVHPFDWESAGTEIYGVIKQLDADNESSMLYEIYNKVYFGNIDRVATCRIKLYEAASSDSVVIHRLRVYQLDERA